MDSAPDRHEQNMARRTLAGSLGVLAGPLLRGLFVYLGLGWRVTYAALAGLSLLCLILAFAMWILLLGPIALLVGLPKNGQMSKVERHPDL